MNNMILVFAGLLALMVLFGCLGTGPALPTANQTNTTKIIPPAPSNISTNFTNNGTTMVPTNQTTGNQTNVTGSNQTNQTNVPAINQTSTNQTSSNQTSTNETTQNQTEPGTPEPAPAEPEGILFAGGKYSLVLDDISVIPDSDKPCGIFSIRDMRPENGSDPTLGRMVICKDQSRYWTDPAGNRYRILVIDVAPGYTQDAKWARAIIYG